MSHLEKLLSKTMKLIIHNYLDLAIEIREAMKIIQYPRVTPSTETLNNYWNPRVSSLMIIILYGSKTSKIMRKCWVSDTKLVCRQDMCCVCRQDICCVCSQDICCVSRQEICSLPRHPLFIAHTGAAAKRPPLCPQCPGDVLADCRSLVC